MIEFIEEFTKQSADLEAQVDEAAEAEDFDLAEQLQEKLESYQAVNQQKVDKYQEMIKDMPDQEEDADEKIGKDSYNPPDFT